MRGSCDELKSELERSPEDWSVRLRLVRMAAEAGELAEAQRLVRESPDEGPLPGELQEQIHAILLEGAKLAQANAIGLPRADD